MFRFMVAFEHAEQIEALPGLEKQVVGLFDDHGNIRTVKIAVNVIETDQRHEVEPGRLAVEQGKYFPPVKIVKGVNRLFTEERMAFGLDENPQGAVRLLDDGQTAVDRNTVDFTRILVFQDTLQCLGVVRGIFFQQIDIGEQIDMLDTDHDNAVGGEVLPDKFEQIGHGPVGQGCLRKQQEVEFAQAALGLADQLEDGENFFPLFNGVDQFIGVVFQSQSIGDLADHAVVMMSPWKFKM